MNALQSFSLMPCNWGVQPAKPDDFIALAKDAEALGYYAVGMPHLPLLPYAQERPVGRKNPIQRVTQQIDECEIGPKGAKSSDDNGRVERHCRNWIP